jgi:hypothetical protein
MNGILRVPHPGSELNETTAGPLLKLATIASRHNTSEPELMSWINQDYPAKTPVNTAQKEESRKNSDQKWWKPFHVDAQCYEIEHAP